MVTTQPQGSYFETSQDVCSDCDMQLKITSGSSVGNAGISVALRIPSNGKWHLKAVLENHAAGNRTSHCFYLRRARGCPTHLSILPGPRCPSSGSRDPSPHSRSAPQSVNLNAPKTFGYFCMTTEFLFWSSISLGIRGSYYQWTSFPWCKCILTVPWVESNLWGLMY